MAYQKQTWNNGPEGNTPQSAARYNHMEAGIAAAAQVADDAAPKTTVVAAGRAVTITKRDGTTTVTSLAQGEFTVNVVLGTTADSVCAGNDARLSNTRVSPANSITAAQFMDDTIAKNRLVGSIRTSLEKADESASVTQLGTKVTALDGITGIRKITQAAYDALGAGRPSDVLYAIVG